MTRAFAFLLMLSATVGAGMPVSAQTITNVAHATWNAGGQPATRASNPVAIDVVPNGPATLTTYRGDLTASLRTSYTPSVCRTRAIPLSVSSVAGQPGAASISRTTQVQPGDDLFFRLRAPAANLDPTVIEAVTAVLVTTGGDRESIVIYETAPDSGEFIGAIPTRAVPPSPVLGDCVLSVADGDVIAIECQRSGTQYVIASASVDVTAAVLAALPVILTNTAGRAIAAPGDAVLYTLTMRNPDPRRPRPGVTLVNSLPIAMRLQPGSVRIDGAVDARAVTIAADGGTLTVALDPLAAGATRIVTYALVVRPDARAGQAINRALVRDARGLETIASAAVRIETNIIAGRMTLIGRVLSGGCTLGEKVGIGGVRVLLEDGSYAITDRDGRYHFEGLLPGDHIAQVDPATLPLDGRLVDCTRGTRAAGSAISRFVQGRGGMLATADFHVAIEQPRADAPTTAPTEPAILSDKAAAGGEQDWFEGGSASIAWLFPQADHNPRSPAVRIAIRHLPGQTIALSADGKPVDGITFDGARTEPGGRFAVSLWRGVPLATGTTHFAAEVRAEDGTHVTRLTRDVAFTTAAAAATFVAKASRLVADGVTRPVVAVRITDRAGRPVHAGMVGEVALSAPYESAATIDAQQTRMLAGQAPPRPTWRIAGDDGIAHVTLAPTTVTGALTLTFTFRDRDTVRVQTMETWLAPGMRDWTIVGLARGSIAARTIAGHLQPQLGDQPDKALDGRVALYAKGRVLGKWLLTLAYDSAKRRADQRLSGAIDPNIYYTVYADRSERRFDAASTRKLYLKLETRQFYALFGDFETGFNDTVLARYARAATGFKAQVRSAHVAGSAFAARIATTHRHDEIQGSGLTGPYPLSARDVTPNSEQVVIETRDRLRSERVTDRRVLIRYVDYDIDYAAGTLRFAAPVLSRAADLSLQFIVADFEIDQARGGHLNAGVRGAWSSSDDRIRIGATAIRDADDASATTLGAIDARVRIAAATELRAEAALSHADTAGAKLLAHAWLIEAEHHSGALDILAYARSLDRAYGLAQQSSAERGRRKIGIDARLRLGETLGATLSAWDDTGLQAGASRRAASAHLDWRTGATDLKLGITHARDQLTAGDIATSTILDAGATQRLFDNRLELDAAASLALDKAASIDFPAQRRVGARFALTPNIALVGGYEIAKGEHIDARTARIGFDVKPWTGARVTSSVGDQAIAEYGRRAYAAYGLAQSIDLGAHWSIDATLDGNRTIGGIDPTRIVNPAHPVAAGGYVGNGVGNGASVTEDFTAVTLGAAYRARAWSATGRAEYRTGSLGDRSGLTLGLIRQLGEGSALGGLAIWSRTTTPNGATADIVDVALSGAFRPSGSAIAALGKIAFRSDRISGAIDGAAGPVTGSILTVTGNAHARRLVGSLSIDWAPYGRDDTGAYQRSELGLFIGTRYVFDRLDGFDLAGVTAMVGLDARIGIGERIDIGAAASVRGNPSAGLAYAAGPNIGIRAAKNMLVTLGYNIAGFADRDFATARTTHQGPFAIMRMKFDQTSFGFLGLARR